MLTPQELQDKKFTKAVFGGYDMREVDDFLDAVMVDYERLYKENALLKGKLKTLADRIEEYRSADDDMRRTFAEAKRAAETELAAAREERENMLAAARAESEELLSSARDRSAAAEREARAGAAKELDGISGEIAAEKQRLEDAKAQTRAFIRSSERLLRAQLEALVELEKSAEGAEVSAPVPAAAPITVDEPTIRFETPVIVDDEPEEISASDEPYIISQSVASVFEDIETAKEEETDFDDSDVREYFASSREINIGGRNVKVFEANQQNVFEDIFSEED